MCKGRGCRVKEMRPVEREVCGSCMTEREGIRREERKGKEREERRGWAERPMRDKGNGLKRQEKG